MPTPHLPDPVLQEILDDLKKDVEAQRLDQAKIWDNGFLHGATLTFMACTLLFLIYLSFHRT